ncbi:MAG: PPC domain-containing DNA-binding protein [Candidatus Bipolaricaulia bacterium]
MLQARDGEDLVVRLVDGEDLLACLGKLALDSAVILGGIGMVRGVRLGYWNGETYEEHRVEEPAELLSMQGNFATSAEGRVLHSHLSIARRDGSVCGGHVLAATVSNTAEIVIREYRRIRLERRPQPSGGMGLYPTSAD